MAKPTTTRYTFAVTFTAPKGLTIKDAREFIKQAIASGKFSADYSGDPIQELDMTSVKIHLTNKEVHYG